MSANPKRVVVKLGTGLLTSSPSQIDAGRIGAVAREVAELRGRGTEVILVSSGAVGLGMGKLGLKRRPIEVSKLQACAAIGQSLLIQTWQKAFDPVGGTVAQVLLTHDDLRLRKRYLAVQETLERLLAFQAVPIINENDTVSSEEIRFGDNDTLSAMVASLLGAQLLVILSMIPGLIDRTGTRRVVPVVAAITPEIERMAGGTDSPTAVGGMVSKLSAARLAGRSGCGVFIASGSEPNVLGRIVSGETVGTFFVPGNLPMEAKKRWLAFFQRPKGSIEVDEGARLALIRNGKSLLASGIVGARGQFEPGDIIDLLGPEGSPFARGVAQFSRAEVDQIRKKSTAELRTLFPERKRLEVVHRDALAVL